jgi:hypothetical protein
MEITPDTARGLPLLLSTDECHTNLSCSSSLRPVLVLGGTCLMFFPGIIVTSFSFSEIPLFPVAAHSPPRSGRAGSLFAVSRNLRLLSLMTLA